MKTGTKAKGTWMHRFGIRFFTLVLAVLIFWVLGFLVDDIRGIRGPDYAEIERAHLDKDLLARRDALEAQIADVTRQIENETEKQRIVGDSSRNLQQTINQLLELQKLGMEKSVSFSDTEQANFAGSLSLFLDNQRRYQELSQAVSDLVERKQGLVRELGEAERQIERQRRPARDAYATLSQKHRLKLAFLQLAILVPILLAAEPINEEAIFLRHKTTRRARYDAAWRAAEARGARWNTGTGMLINQAALNIEMWTGKKPDKAVMLKALQEALN